MVSRTENKQKDIFQAGSTVAIPAYYSLRDKLIQKYPDVHWIIVENTSTALSSLNLGKVDSVVTTQLAARYIIDHYYPETMSYQRIPNQPSAQIAFAVPRDKPELQSILNKALAEIPPKETLSLAGKWIKMPEVKIDTWDLYSRPFYILTVSAVLLILSSLLWGGYLLRAIRREKASQAALEYQLSLRQTLSNSIPVPVYITTPEGEIEVTTVPSTRFLRRNKERLYIIPFLIAEARLCISFRLFSRKCSKDWHRRRWHHINLHSTTVPKTVLFCTG
ncbi:hypothetical protein D364_16975 [Klebsiella pneumoniae CG43]|nr:hypothetical protein D364_16975 [Klebsiella pneumoniae CG43]